MLALISFLFINNNTVAHAHATEDVVKPTQESYPTGEILKIQVNHANINGFNSEHY